MRQACAAGAFARWSRYGPMNSTSRYREAANRRCFITILHWNRIQPCVSICIATVPPPMAFSRPPPWCSGPTRRRRAAGADRPRHPVAGSPPGGRSTRYRTGQRRQAVLPGVAPPSMCWATVSTSTRSPAPKYTEPCTAAAGRAPKRRNRPTWRPGVCQGAGGRAGDPAGPGRQRQRAGAAAFRQFGPGRLGQGSRRRVPQVAGAGKLERQAFHGRPWKWSAACARRAPGSTWRTQYHYDFTRTKRRRLVADSPGRRTRHRSGQWRAAGRTGRGLSILARSSA